MKALNIKQAKANLVISHICSYFSLTPQSLNKKFNKTNEIEYVWPRQILEYILFVTIKLPGKEIEFITGVDHTTTVHSKKTVLNEIRNITKSEIKFSQLKIFSFTFVEFLAP